MAESEKDKQHKKQVDVHLQAQLFYYLKTRVEINRNFDPCLFLSEKVKAKQISKTEKESPNTLALQKKHDKKKKQAINILTQGYKMFVTQVTAMDAKDGRLKSYSGPHIVARDREEAQGLIDNTGLGYCEILGELIGLIDTDGNDVKDNYRDN